MNRDLHRVSCFSLPVRRKKSTDENNNKSSVKFLASLLGWKKRLIDRVESWRHRSGSRDQYD